MSGNFNLDVCEMNEMAFFSVSFLSVNTFTSLKKSSKSCPHLIWTFELKFKYFKLSKFFNIWVKATKNFRRSIGETYFHEKKSWSSLISFLCFFPGYQGPFWQPNSPSLLSFCFFHQFDCYDVIDYCRNNCPQFTGCGT